MKRPHLWRSNRLPGALGRRKWKIDVVLSCSENWWTGMQYFVLSFVSLYEPGVLWLRFGIVSTSLYATGSFKQGCFAVMCAMQATREQERYKINGKSSLL